MGCFELRAVSFLQNCVWADGGFKGAQESAMLVVTPKPSSNEEKDIPTVSRGNDAGYVVIYPNGTAPGLFRPRIVSESFDSERTRKWLQNCRDCHGSECRRPSPTVEAMNMNLIDCETLEVIPATASMTWVALSYVWGMQKAVVSNSHPSLPSLQLPSPIPPLISDTITVVKSLGYRYLWADKYCIDHQSEPQKHDNINNMDLIYGGAELTIIAASGAGEDQSLPGIVPTKRSKQQVVELPGFTILSTGPDPIASIIESKWWTRAWTFQEAFLSPRKLVFTEHQTYFECIEVSWNESIGGLEFIENSEQVDFSRFWKASSFLMNPYMGRTISRKYWDGGYLKECGTLHAGSRETHKMLRHRHHELFKLAENYCSRDLTFDSDSLNAFFGVLRFLERNSMPPTLHLWGLPYVALSSTDDEAVEMYLTASLCWYHLASSSIRRRCEFPSWTWVGWAGPIRSIRLYEAQRWVPRTREILLEDKGGHIHPAAQYLQNGTNSHGPDSVGAVSLTAREVPATFVSTTGGTDSWSDCTVAGHGLLVEGVQLPTATPSIFLERLRTNAWSCLLLGDYWPDKSSKEEEMRFLLVVEWKDSETATRIGILLVQGCEGSGNEVSSFFDESNLRWIQVCLV
ncbi:tol [Fusarium sp. NRRL 52700]|nr:tol [Fusarium sp. NRRL 52700]